MKPLEPIPAPSTLTENAITAVLPVRRSHSPDAARTQSGQADSPTAEKHRARTPEQDDALVAAGEIVRRALLSSHYATLAFAQPAKTLVPKGAPTDRSRLDLRV